MARAFRIEELKPGDLAGGGLAKLLASVVVPDKAWAKHVAKLGKGTGKKTCKAFSEALGHDVPKEIAEWLDLEGKRGIPEPHDSGWWIALDAAVPEKGAAGAQKALAKQALLLLTGLAPFGTDASGDQVFASLRPHPLGVAEVYLFNHENGEVEEKEGESIADFIVHKWVCADDPDDDDARPGWIGKEHKKVAAAQKAFAAKAKKALAKREKHLAPGALWERSHWLFGLLAGEPAFRFPQHLARAPSLATYRREKPTLVKQPQLALYWILAHLFFGDDDACREAATLARKSKGRVVRELAASALAFLDGKRKSPFDALSAASLAKGRALVAKNALAEQVAKKPAKGSKATSDAGSDASSHDAALEALAKSDPSKAPLIKDYFSERTSEAYNHWPYKKTIPDWLVAPAAAAFRAGLAVDLGHPKAYAGVTRAIAERADHPDARAALIAALGTLAPDDDRLEHVVGALVPRTEPEVREAIRGAAWRWLDAAASIDEVLKKRQERNTLDDMVAKDDHLQPAVHSVLKACDEEAEKLAVAISAKQLSFRVLKTTGGLVLRVYGKRGMNDRLERMQYFLSLLDGVPGSKDPEEPGVRLDTTASVAMAEASLAIARIDPADARTRFAAMLARPRRTPDREAAVAACLLPGILALDASDATGLQWLERVLGARAAPPWVYGAIVAAREAKVISAASWILPHAYASRINSMMDEFAQIEATAREALEALGQPAPPFDEDDEYARNVPPEQLGSALLVRGKYDKGAVVERIRESKRLVEAVPAVGAFLQDSLRFSKWEPRSHFTDDELRDAIAILTNAGEEGAKEIARLAELPEIGDWAKEMLRGE